MEKVYRVQKNGIDVENSATNLKNVAFAHANSIFSESPESIVKVVCSQVIETTIAKFCPFKCRLRIGDTFEIFDDLEKLQERITFYVNNKINFSILF